MVLNTWIFLAFLALSSLLAPASMAQQPLIVDNLEGGGTAKLTHGGPTSKPKTKNGCDPATNVAIGSITTTTGIVSWQPSGSPVYYIVEHRIANQGGNWASANVYNSAYTLTNLSPCKTYEVRLRTFCGGQNYSAYTTPVQFNTASTNPTLNVEATYFVDDDCAVKVELTHGFISYTWNRGATSFSSHDTCALWTSNSGYYTVSATDANGCVANTSFTINSFPSTCITPAVDAAARDSIVADSAMLNANVKLLGKGLAGVMNHATIKSLVKTIALKPNNYSYAKLKELSDSCTAHNLNLTNLLKTALWNNGATAIDTAKIQGLINNPIEYNTSPVFRFHYGIYYPYLDPNYQDPNFSPAWDTLTPKYVVPFAFGTTNSCIIHTENNGTITTGTMSFEAIQGDIPAWHVQYYFDMRNLIQVAFITRGGAGGGWGCKCSQAPGSVDEACCCGDPVRSSCQCGTPCGGIRASIRD